MSELSVRQYLHNDGSGLTLGYDKFEADKVIADKDAEIDRLKAAAKEPSVPNRTCRKRGRTGTLMKCDNLVKYGMDDPIIGDDSEMYRVADVDEAIEELKRENRRLKRALWLARGYIMTLLNRDFQRLAYQCNNDDYKINLLRRRNRYYELSEKCLKKAEESK